MAVHLHQLVNRARSVSGGRVDRMSNTFSVLVGGRSWDWLRELCRPLGVQAQLLDEACLPLLPPETPAAGQPGVSIRELTAREDRPLLAPVTRALQTRAPQSVHLDDADFICTPLVVEGRSLRRARRGPARRDRARHAVSGEQLSTVCGWLAGAVERHLSSAVAGPDNLSALHKVLQHVVQGGTDRDLVAVFAEALALWHDIEVVGYIETAPGVFMRAASLAGRMVQDRPIVFPTQSLPLELRVTRIPQTDINGMESAGPGDVLVTLLTRGDGNGTWLLTMSGAIDACDPQVLGNYVSALDMAVALATAASRTRVAMLLSHRLSASPGEAGGGFEAALDALRAALTATAASIAVESTGRRIVYHAGSAEIGSAAGDADRARMLVRRVMPGGAGATLTLVRADHQHFTPLEHSMALVAAELLADWVVKPAAIETRRCRHGIRTHDRTAGERSARARARGDGRGCRHQRRGAWRVAGVRRRAPPPDAAVRRRRRAPSGRSRSSASRHDRGARGGRREPAAHGARRHRRLALVDQGDRVCHEGAGRGCGRGDPERCACQRAAPLGQRGHAFRGRLGRSGALVCVGSEIAVQPCGSKSWAPCGARWSSTSRPVCSISIRTVPCSSIPSRSCPTASMP